MVGWAGSQNKRIKSRYRPDEGMMESIVLACACVVAIYAGLGGFAWWLRREIEEIMTELDGNLAQAIQKVLQDLPIGDFEPPNPVQMMIMELIQSNMKPKTIISQSRDDSGLFVASESES